MTPRSSVRARAQEIYREMAQGEAGVSASPCASTPHPSSLSESEVAPTPDPSPLLARASGGGENKEPDLTARVRALYETPAVPVREIAAIAGVTERTIYKYVEKHDWKRRYRWAAPDKIANGEGAASGKRGRRWQVSSDNAGDLAVDVAPAKGAGGRFIRRTDKGKSFATGLKAVDPTGRGKALAACGKAQRLSRAAQAEAAADAQHERVLRALALVTRVANGLNAYQQERRKNRAATRADDPLLRLHQLTFSRAVEELEQEMVAKTALLQRR